MNYRHGYHAGNFCDVFKHLILMRLVEHLKQKDKGFTVLDAHAGDGTYSLRGEFANKTQEAESGILRALEWNNPSPMFGEYLHLVRRLGLPDAAGKLTSYPGSPRITRALLRAQDKLLLTDIHPEALQSLRRLFKDDKQVRIQPQEANLALKAHLPPESRRGLVLLDPPFEIADEFKQLVNGMKEAWKRFPTGVYAIWYPIKNAEPVRYFHRQLAASGIKPILTAELQIAPLNNVQLNGTGMSIINPPWKLHEELQVLLPELLAALALQDSGETRLEWTVPE